MYRLLLRSYAPFTSRRRSSGPLRDLKRDWQRWSRTERAAAECLLAIFLIGGMFLAVALPHW